MWTCIAKYMGTLFIVVSCGQPSIGQSTSTAERLQQIRAQELKEELMQLSQQTTAMQKLLLDWPMLARYRKDDVALPPPTRSEHRVVFYGDSITDVWGRLPGKGKFFPGKPYINRGISGQTTAQLLVRFSQDVVHLKPSVVVVLAGINDIAGNTGPATPEMIEDNFAAMASIAKQNGIKMVIASIPPSDRIGWAPSIESADEIRQVNGWLRDFCSTHGFVYLNYYDSLVDSQGGMRPGYSSDGIHPTDKGYAVMAPLAEQAIDHALADK